jgi:hypothetical protein
MELVSSLENQKARDYLEDLGVEGTTILEWNLGKQGGKVWSGLIWLKTGTSGALLWTRKRTFGLYERRRI